MGGCLMFVYRDLPFCDTEYALCESGYCYLGTLIRGPEVFLGIHHWRRLKASRDAHAVELVIPTISQDCQNLEIHEG